MRERDSIVHDVWDVAMSLCVTYYVKGVCPLPGFVDAEGNCIEVVEKTVVEFC